MSASDIYDRQRRRAAWREACARAAANVISLARPVFAGGHCGAPSPRPRTRASGCSGAVEQPPRRSPRRETLLAAASALATRSTVVASARSDALQVRDGQSARAERQSTPPHQPDIKPTILCGSNLILCCASRDMDLDVRVIKF